MAKKSHHRTFNVSVIGLSGAEKGKEAMGVGKSCLCNRFICQVSDKYSHDHISILSQSDFAGRVINKDHFLYWGEVTKTDDDSDLTFHIIEQTEFIDDVSFEPFKTEQIDSYHKRCIMRKVKSAGKLMYICKDQLGMESDSSYEQKIMPDGKLTVDGFICCFDVSQTQQRPPEHQFDFVIHLLNDVLKTKKPVVLVTTKTDDLNESHLKEAAHIVARKEFKNKIPLISTSAHQDVNIELAFMTLAHLIDKTKTRPQIIPFSKAVQNRGKTLDVASEAYKSMLMVQVSDSKAIWSSTKRKLEKELDFGHYVDFFGIESAKRLFEKHISYLHDEHINNPEQFFLRKLPETINHFLPDLISINDRPWSACKQYIADHPDFDTYFVELTPGDESWKSKHDIVENDDEIRIPFDLLNSSGAEKCFQNHLANLQSTERTSRLKKRFKIALEENQHVIPGKSLGETYIFFVGKECFNDLPSQEREQVYEQHQAELRQQAKLEFQELLWEKLELFIRMIGTSDTYTQEDIKSITMDLENDYRYRKLDKIKEVREIVLLNHLGFMECPSKDRCHFREKCAENKVQLLLASRPVRIEPETMTQPTDCSPLNIVLLGTDGLATSVLKEIRLVYSKDEFQCFGKLYSLDYRTIEDDINVEFNTLAIFKPHVCICAYNSRESFDYVKASLVTTDDNNFTLQDLPIVIVQAYNNNLSEKELAILHESGQNIAKQLECGFIDIPFDYKVQDLFCRQQITRALESLGIAFNNNGRPLSEIMGPVLRVGMCLMCGDDFSADIPLGPLLNSNPTQVRSDTDTSITIEVNLQNTTDLTKQKIEVCCGSYHNFVVKIQKQEEEDVYHGFVLVFSPKRKASFCTMNAFADLLRRYWPSMPILILAITEIGASSEFFQDEKSQSLIQKAIKLANDLGVEYMTTPSNFQNQEFVYNDFLKEAWQTRDVINDSYHHDASSTAASDERMAKRPPYPLPEPYDANSRTSSKSNSLSTDDSDHELERLASTSSLPFRTESLNAALLPFAGTSEDFHKLLSTGTYESFENRVFLCGSCACGKSTLSSVLIGSPIPDIWKSTDGLVIHFGRNGINLETYEMVPLKEEGHYGQNVLTKVVIGKPNRDKTSMYQSVDTHQNHPIEQTSTGTDNMESKPQAKQSDINKSTNVFESAGIQISQEIPVTNTNISEIKQVESINLPKMKTKKIEAYAVHDDILREVKSGQYKIKVAPSDLVDFGGQHSYDMTHQLFVQHGGTFVVMFDGSKDFYEPLEEYPMGDVSNESIVKHWVNSILTYCVDDTDVMPMIVFAATHSDCLSEDMQKKRKKEFVDKFIDMFGTHERNKHFVFESVFFINGTDREDHEIQNLKTQLVSIARNQPSWGLRRPMIWVPLELLIANMKKDNINIIPKSHLVDANTMNGDLALSEKQMNNFLLTQHASGKIMYFNQPELSNFIILYPPALVNILRSFITDVMFWPEDENLRNILRRMTDTGKIYNTDLLQLWEQKQFRNHIPDNDTKDFIIQVLVHLDILVLPKRYSGKSDAHADYYLVPCTVKNKMPMSFLDEQSFANRTLSLVYKLQKSSIPSALSFKLIGAVSSIWPIMEVNGHPLLYHSSAVLCVDGKTEFRIIVEDTKVIVYLTHRSSKSSISPDIAASIQECLTSTLQVVLQFYLTSIGESNQNADVSNLFHIEVGEVCDKSPCVVTISKANMDSDWVCNRGNEHSSRYPLLWFFNKTLNECPSNCPGLAKVILTKSPSEQDLARFADQLTNNTCRDLVLHLGLEQKDWQDIEDSYTGMSLIIRIMALHCWKTKRIKGKPTKSFSNLLDAMKAVDETRHLLCKVFREDTDLLDIADVRLQEIPQDDVLDGLPENLGNCAVQLGIELGITVSSIKETMVRYHKDMYKQIADILRKWKSSIQVKPTIYRLMLALERVDTGGLDYLKKIYLGQ